jgi:hypothetical protein
MQTFINRLLKLCTLMCLMFAFSAHAQLGKSMGLDSNLVCWKDSYGRGVGTIPGSCGPGQTKSGLLCYNDCKPGENNVAGVCWSGCPEGTTDIGATCVKKDVSSYGRGAGYVIWDEDKCNKAHRDDWNDKIKVARLSQGVIVRAYEHPNFGGAFIDLKPNGQQTLDGSWHNRISSMKIRTMVSAPTYGFNGDDAVFKIEDRVAQLNRMLPMWSEAAAWYQTEAKSGVRIDAVRRLRVLELAVYEAYALNYSQQVKNRAYEQLQDYHQNDRAKLLVYADVPATNIANLTGQMVERKNTIAEIDRLAGSKSAAALGDEWKKLATERDELDKLIRTGPRQGMVRNGKDGHLSYPAAGVEICFFDQKQSDRDVPGSNAQMKGNKTHCVTTNAEGFAENSETDWRRMRSAFVPSNVQVGAYKEKGFAGASRDLDPSTWIHFGDFGGINWDAAIGSFKVAPFSPKACFWGETSDLIKRSSEERQCWQPDRDIAEMPKGQGCEKSGALWYPQCRQNFSGEGPVCWSTTRCTGGTTDAGLFCTKNSYVQAPITPSCGGQKEYDAGLCYDACKTGYNGIGPVCWGTCPSKMSADCGAMCGASQGECGKAIGGQVVSGLEVVGTVAAVAATGGGAAAAKAGAVAGAKAAAKAVSKELAQRTLKNLKDEMSKNVDKQSAAYKMMQGDLSELEKALSGDDFDPTALDPTGIADLVKTFDKPTCVYQPAEKKTPPANAVNLAATVVAMMATKSANAVVLASATEGSRPIAAAIAAPIAPASTDVLQVIESRWIRGRCIDANSGGAVGVPMDGTVMWDCNGNANQRFVYDFKLNMIRYPAKNLCLETGGRSQPARFVACNTAENKQKWNFELGTNAIRNAGDNMCLDVNMGNAKNGSPVTSWDCHGKSNQAWSFLADTPQKLSVKLEPRHAPNMCLDAADSGNSAQQGQSAILWNCHGRGNQRFFYDQQSKVITMPEKGLCLRSSGKGKQATFVPCESFNDQQWTITANNSLRSVRFGTCLDVSNNGKGNGTQIVDWDCHNGANQQWNFVK